MELKCPYWESDHIVKNGITRHKKQNYKCNRQFVINPKNQPIRESTIELVDNLLLERISMRGIKRVAKVSLQWLQSYVSGKSVRVETQVKVTPKKKCA